MAEKEKEREKDEGAATETLWVMSNRRDDRVVLFERDARHPGGEAFIGGSTPDEVFRTGEIERLLHAGLIVEIPEPPESRKKPVPIAATPAGPAAAQPGQAIALGRALDPDLVPAGAVKEVEKRQAGLPQQVPAPAGAVTPPAPGSEKRTQRS